MIFHADAGRKQVKKQLHAKHTHNRRPGFLRQNTANLCIPFTQGMHPPMLQAMEVSGDVGAAADQNSNSLHTPKPIQSKPNQIQSSKKKQEVNRGKLQKCQPEAVLRDCISHAKHAL